MCLNKINQTYLEFKFLKARRKGRLQIFKNSKAPEFMIAAEKVLCKQTFFSFLLEKMRHS